MDMRNSSDATHERGVTSSDDTTDFPIAWHWKGREDSPTTHSPCSFFCNLKETGVGREGMLPHANKT